MMSDEGSSGELSQYSVRTEDRRVFADGDRVAATP